MCECWLFNTMCVVYTRYENTSSTAMLCCVNKCWYGTVWHGMICYGLMLRYIIYMYDMMICLLFYVLCYVM